MSLSFEQSLKNNLENNVAKTRVASEDAGIATMSIDEVNMNASVMTLDETYGIAAYSGDDGSWQLDESGRYRSTETSNFQIGQRYEDSNISYVDENKNVKIDQSQINLTQEDNSQYIPFEMFRYYDGIDLMSQDLNMKIYIFFVNENGDYGESSPINVRYNDTKIRFGFVVPKEATAIKGKLKLEIHVRGASPLGGNYVLKTKPNDEIEVLESLQGNGNIIVDENWATSVLEDVKQAAQSAEASAAIAKSYANQASSQYTSTQSMINQAQADMEAEISNASTTISNNIKAEMAETYYTQDQVETRFDERLGAIQNEDGNELTVEAYVEQEIANADIEGKLTAYATTESVKEMIGDTGLAEDGVTPVSVVDYVDTAVDSVDVTDQLGDTGTNEDGTPKTVVQYVDDAIASVDVTEQLADYAKSADVYTKGETYSKTEVDDAVKNVKVDLTGYATETFVNEKVSPINTAITTINQTLEGIDRSPRVTYDATYGDVELDDGSTAEYMFTLWKTENGERTPQDRFQILGGGGGSGSSVTMKIAYVDGYPRSIVKTVNDDIVIKYNFEGIDSAGDYVGGTASWKVGSKVVLTEEVSSGENQVDITEYIGIGETKVLLTITHSTGAIATKEWTIKVVDVRLESSFDNTRAYTAGSTVGFTYTPYGAIDKTVHFVLDGTEIGTKESKSSAAGLSDSYTLPAQEHGSYLLEIYMTATINEKEVKSNYIYKDIIWYDEESDAAVIACSTPEISVMQHDTTDIVFTVYDPTTETPTVSIEDNGEVIATLSNLSDKTNTYTYVATAVGSHELVLVCGNTRKPITIIVEELNINITPVTASLAFDFNPVGYSNSNEDKLWSYESETEGETIVMTVSDNFDWVNGGYQSDRDGSYFCIKAGTTATINYRMFCASQNIKEQGGNYKLVFKTMNVQDASQPFFQCYKNNIGVIMQPHETNFYAGSGNTLYLAYSENDTIEFELNMGEEILNSSDKMVMGYEDGVATKPLVYTSGASFIQGIQDSDAEYITLGSTSCDLYIYRFKAFRKSLTSKEVLNNFITDARNASEMLKRYNRNQIYNEAVNDLNVSTGYSESYIEHFAKQCPDLHVFLLSCPRFTKSKSDKVQGCTLRQIYANGREVEDNWTVYNMIHSGQGTSSNLYGASGRNLDFIMNKKNDAGEYPWIEFSDGSILEGKELEINLTETSVPVNYLNFKANIASSENANNAELARRYNRFNPYKRPLVREEGYPYEVKDTMEFYNAVVFVQETDTTQDANGNYTAHVEFNDCNYHYYALGNIGDSKKTDDTRMNDPDDVNEFVIEIMDNNLPNSKFQSGVYDELGYSITGADIAAEWRTYKDDTYEMDGKYTVVTNTDKVKYLIDENLPILYELIDGEYVLTSDETIDSSKTYYEKNYPNAAYTGLYKDKYAYDIEKGETELESGWGISFECRYEHNDADHDEHKRIWNEFYEFVIFSSDVEFYENLSNYCVLDSVMFYYLFTLRYTMIDNRAKNSFFHYGKCEDGIYRWDLTMDYDNDSALGIDNFGKQIYRYGYEDFDYVDSDVATDEDGNSTSENVWVFNAATSTFYNRLRLLFAPELRALYNTLDGNGAWSAEDLITQFDNSQSQFPEEVWRQDIIRKYIRPYTTSYINGSPDDTFLKEKMNGRKKYHRREFERSQKIYMDSKYRTEDATMNFIQLRANVPAGDLAVPANLDLTITPYMHMYVSVDYANGVVTRQYRAKAGEPVVVDYPLSEGDIIAIENASYLQSIGDISPIYTKIATLQTATRLKEILLGNSTEGYSNNYLETFSMVKDGLVETINIENIPSLDDELDFSTLKNLKTLLAKGSNVSGLTLAKNCLIETLSLPDLSSILSMKNLSYLNDIDIDSLENLSRLIVEDCDFSALENFVINEVSYDSPNELTFLDNAPNLQRVRLTGIDWTLSDTSVLERLYSTSIGGYNANGGETTRAYLSGKVTVPTIGQYELYKYQELWSDLTIIPRDGIIPQYKVTFMNHDGTELDVQYIDQYGDAVDPITRVDNPIATPIKESTIQYSYTFSGWDKTFTNIITDIDVYATYEESLREYTIQYVSMGTPVKTVTGKYGDNIIYDGDIPTYTAAEPTAFYLFNRWDKSGFLTGDFDNNGVKTVTAIFDKFDKGATYFEGKELENLSPVEIYALTKLNKAGKINIKDVITDKDFYSFSLGHDFDYDDVESVEIIGENSEFGDQYKSVVEFNGSNYFDTGIQLFDEDKDFILALDYEYTNATTDAVLAQCYQGGIINCGFKLEYNSGVRLKWGSNTSNIANVNEREMVVIRHKKGDTNLIVYSSNLNGMQIEISSLASKEFTSTTSLIFGCEKQTSIDFTNYASGKIHWAKIWYKDLGEDACKNIALWTHEKIELEADGFNRYYLADNPDGMCSFSLICTHLLERKRQMNTDDTNVGGWANSSLNAFLNQRLYNAIPTQIKSLIKPVIVWSSVGGGSSATPSTELSFSNCHIVVPALKDLDGINSSGVAKSEPYNSESFSSISIFSGVETRKRAFIDGGYSDYWLRSPSIGHSRYFWRVSKDGAIQSSQAISTADAYYGVLIEISF